MSKQVRLLFRVLVGIAGLMLMIYGHKKISITYLGIMLIGLGMIVLSLFLYNRQFTYNKKS